MTSVNEMNRSIGQPASAAWPAISRLHSAIDEQSRNMKCNSSSKCNNAHTVDAEVYDRSANSLSRSSEARNRSGVVLRARCIRSGSVSTDQS